ncbi:MAG: AAA family ATPase, partial [Candidatus Contubernalis sp.]|nr:AAA family ATPase [Candidatus Contubernalis sp.]
MRFNNVNLKAFGFFSDHKLEFEKDINFHIIYGLNEAGKSTLLRAITDVLYGIPHNTQDAFWYSPSDLKIEAVIQHSDGRILQFTRRKGNKNTILDSSGSPLRDAGLQEFLGDINRGLFSNMFGLNYETLREGGENLLKGGGSVGESLFEAVAGISSLRNVFQELDSEARDLFKSGGRVTPINACVKEYLEAKKRLNQLFMPAKKWEEQEKNYWDEEKKMKSLKEEVKTLQNKKSRLERIIRSLPLLVQKNVYQSEIKQMGSVPLLVDSISVERIKLTEILNNDRSSKIKIRKRLEDLENRKKLIKIPEKIVEKAAAISIMHERLETYRNHVNEMPLLTGEKNELQQAAKNYLKELYPSISSLEEADKYRPSLEHKKKTRRLISSHENLLQEDKTCKKNIKKINCDIDRKQQQLMDLGNFKDASQLRRAVTQAQKEGSLEEAILKKEKERKLLEDKASVDLKSLGLWSETLEQLKILALPLPETVKRYEEELDLLQSKLTRLDEKIEAEKKEIQETEERLRDLEKSGEVPTGEKLEQVRAHRQRGWELIRRAWLDRDLSSEEELNFDPDNSLDRAYELSVDKADQVADNLRLEAERVARKENLLDNLEQSGKKFRELKEEKSIVLNSKQILYQEWEKTWEGTGISPLSPKEMLAWMERCSKLCKLAEDLRQISLEIQFLEDKVTEHRVIINSEFEKLGESPTVNGESLEVLLARAQEICNLIDKTNISIEKNQQDRKNLLEELKKTQSEMDDYEEKMISWSADWEKALKRLGLPSDANPLDVESFLDKLEEFFGKVNEISIKETRISEMNRYIKDFQHKTSELLIGQLSDFNGLPPEQSVTQLHDRLNKANIDQSTLKEIKDQIEKEKKALKQVRENIELNSRQLKKLKNQASVQTVIELEEAEGKSRLLRELYDKVKSIETQLLEYGSGLTLEEIEEDAWEIDKDSLPGELDEVKSKLEKMDEERSIQEQKIGALKKTYDEMRDGKSTAALEASEDAQGTLAKLHPMVDQYARLRLASAILRRGVERY